MNDCISRSALYEKTAEWEAQALHMVKLHMRDDDKAEWRKWCIALNERSAFKYDVADAPAADAVPVVRCKDCRWYVNDYNDAFCDRDGYSHNGNWYCADGERRE